MFLRTFRWNYKEIRMTSLCSIHLQLIIVVLLQPHVGCLKRHEKKRMFFRTFFTWNNTFFCNLAHQATKQMHMGCFGTYKQQLYVYVYFKWASKTLTIYKYSNISRQLARAYNTKEFNLSHVNIFHNSYSMSFNMNIFFWFLYYFIYFSHIFQISLILLFTLF